MLDVHRLVHVEAFRNSEHISTDYCKLFTKSSACIYHVRTVVLTPHPSYHVGHVVFLYSRNQFNNKYMQLYY
jgi:hypothetical protein